MRRKSAAFDPIDIHVGSRVRMLRNLLGMSQTELGDAAGVSFQQLQKYEKGANRISASKLFEISKALEAPVSFFFDDMPDDVAGRRNVGASLSEIDVFNTQDAGDVLRAYYAIEDREVRSALSQMVKAMARSGKDR
jgi:transcriptional regulator with XRE-family HTH domain